MNKYKKILTDVYRDLVGSDIINLIVLFIPSFIDPTEFIIKTECVNHSCEHQIPCDDICNCEMKINKPQADGYDNYAKELDIENVPNKIPFDQIHRKIKNDYFKIKYLVVPDKKTYFNIDLPRTISNKPCQKTWGFIEMFCSHHSQAQHYNPSFPPDTWKCKYKYWLGFNYLTWNTFEKAAYVAKEMYYNKPKCIHRDHPSFDDEIDKAFNDKTIEKNHNVIVRKVIFKMCDSE